METYIADFHMIIYNSKTEQAPTPEDMKYILNQFTKAVHDRGFIYSGTCEVKEASEIKEGK